MRVSLRSEIFEAPVENTLIVTLFGYALEGRHRIEANLSHPSIAAWLTAQSLGLREEVSNAVNFSLQEEVREPSATSVVVGRFDASDYGVAPVVLRLQDARTFLEAPISVHLENDLSDLHFLLKMATSEERRFIEGRIARGFLRIEPGGGVGNLRQRIEGRNQNPAARHTQWVLFDSDSLRPGSPSAQSEALRQACGVIPHHQLVRRYIESYLPIEALVLWATAAGGRARGERFAKVRALVRLRRDQQHHFNMKGGFDQDANRTDASAGDLYDDVHQDIKDALARGFGTSIKDLFEGDYVTESDLRTNSGWSELRPVMQTLLMRQRSLRLGR